MVYAMLASIAYIEEDFDAIERYTDRTRQAALALKPSDPLRGHLYEGVSYGFDAALGIARNGVALGLPRALPNLNKLYASIRSANAVDPDDPELNLLNGYMDLLLTRRERAVEQLSKASPTYVSYRGMALAYRDLDRDREALEAVEKAMAGQCDNPELYYLKAQILRILERNSESVDFYNRALAAADQLPPAVVRDIKKERDRTQQRLTSSKPVAGI
jgi:tetratricopeptide (TPR) repeat protein